MTTLFFRFVFLCVIGAIALHVLRTIMGPKISKKTPGAQAAFDPHSILGVGPKATAAEIRDAYHKALAQYHPDKVSHLGPDLQEVAKRKTLDIIKAYEKIGRDS